MHDQDTVALKLVRCALSLSSYSCTAYPDPMSIQFFKMIILSIDIFSELGSIRSYLPIEQDIFRGDISFYSKILL